MNTRTLGRTALIAAIAATLAACSSAPARNAALDHSRESVTAAQANPQVVKLAPDELRRATDALHIAEQAQTAGAPPARVNHLAYLTDQRAAIAQDTAAALASQAIVAGAAAERDRVRLALRTNEADAAHKQLAIAQDTNARQASALAVADASAADAHARMEQKELELSNLQAQLQELNARKTDRGMVITLGDVLFDTGQSRLLPERGTTFTKLADFFKRNPQQHATIDGYTDSVGSACANVDLSQRRATAVKSRLVDLGVNSDNLSTRAHGADDPVAGNETAAGRQLNRRVEIVFAAPAAAVSAN